MAGKSHIGSPLGGFAVWLHLFPTCNSKERIYKVNLMFGITQDCAPTRWFDDPTNLSCVEELPFFKLKFAGSSIQRLICWGTSLCIV